MHRHFKIKRNRLRKGCSIIRVWHWQQKQATWS